MILISRRMGALRLEIMWLTCTLAVCASVADAQKSARDLAEASLEDLMNIQITSVSKKEQKLVTAPAAVYVVTQEDIRRSGLSSIPEILRMVPGLDVAQIDTNQWAISSRGFNGQFANKMLVLIDGRSVYLAGNSGVYWDEQDTLIEDIDRIEVIRGPGAALWGANAVNGVINIITKSSKDTQGGLAVTRAGNEDHTVDEFRYGGTIGIAGTYRAYSKYLRRADHLSDSDTMPGADWTAARGGFRTDWTFSNRDTLTLQGDLFNAKADLEAKVPDLTPPFHEFIGSAAGEKTSGGNVMMNWSHRSSDRSIFTFKSYFDQSRKTSDLIDQRYRTANAELQHAWTPAERHEIVWGVAFRYNVSSFVDSPTLSFPNLNERLYSAFAQDQIHLVQNKLFLILGTKFEHNDFTGFDVQPSMRLLWTPGPKTSVWAAVSRAVRTPSYFNLGGQLNLAAFPTPGGLPAEERLFGSPQFQSETLRAHEIGYRSQISKRLSFDWTAFYNVYHHLSTYEPCTPLVTADPQPLHLVIPLTFSNLMHGGSFGSEISTTWEVMKGWRVISSYSWLDLHLRLDPSSHDTVNQAAEGQSPKHQIQFRSDFDLSRQVQFDSSVYYVGALPALSVPAYTRVDARLSWRPTPPLELSVGGQNLQGGKHLEFVSEGPFAPTRIGRSFYARVAWQF